MKLQRKLNRLSNDFDRILRVAFAEQDNIPNSKKLVIMRLLREDLERVAKGRLKNDNKG